MASKWEPGAVAWGVVAFYLLLAVEITSLLRSSISENLWRKVHYGGFAVFLFGTIHGLKAGTDVSNPLIWWPAALAAAGVVGLCAYRILAGEEMRIAPKSERIPRALLEKTLTELERFDTEAYPAAAPAETVAPERIFEPLSSFPLRAAPSAAPDPVAQQLAATIAERLAAEEQTLAPAAPEPQPAAAEWAPPFEPLPQFERPSAPPAPEERWEPPVSPPVPSRTTAAETLLARALPTRTPQRLATTTSAAGLGVWTPASRPVHDTTVDAGPPPPPEADPATGEPDPQAYRRWLREWLAYVESQP
jgi:hypothetical protein